ncbi:hypothetical protein [Candidatus Skiveiella danica]|uniref:hypothetical protein n=1 Tax=Candidatus Skiveiella danica TaxID=3386177 RepID=UPI0039B8A87F
MSSDLADLKYNSNHPTFWEQSSNLKRLSLQALDLGGFRRSQWSRGRPPHLVIGFIGPVIQSLEHRILVFVQVLLANLRIGGSRCMNFFSATPAP